MWRKFCARERTEIQQVHDSDVRSNRRMWAKLMSIVFIESTHNTNMRNSRDSHFFSFESPSVSHTHTHVRTVARIDNKLLNFEPERNEICIRLFTVRIANESRLLMYYLSAPIPKSRNEEQNEMTRRRTSVAASEYRSKTWLNAQNVQTDGRRTIPLTVHLLFPSKERAKLLSSSWFPNEFFIRFLMHRKCVGARRVSVCVRDVYFNCSTPSLCISTTIDIVSRYQSTFNGMKNKVYWFHRKNIKLKWGSSSRRRRRTKNKTKTCTTALLRSDALPPPFVSIAKHTAHTHTQKPFIVQNTY